MKDIKKCRVLVTPTSYGQTDQRLWTELEEHVGEIIHNQTGKPLTSGELSKLLPGVDGYIAGLDVIDRACLQHADKLKVISRYGVGCDRVDLKAAREKGITVTYTPGANSASVAEMTIALTLALARKIPQAVEATRQGSWPRLNALSLEGKTFGIVGLGSIGKQVARRLAGFDCTILAFDVSPDQDFALLYKVSLVSLGELIERSDFISLHLPVLPETRGMVNAGFLSGAKEGAFLINTARGELVNERDLVSAMEAGTLAGAALDVFTTEPPDSDNVLLKMPQVIVTPHISSHSDGALNAMGWMALKDCLAVLRGDTPANPVP